MIIKKFQGKTENEAIEAAKKEMGPAVVVMNEKTVKKKGLLYLFSRPYVEVTVALEEETEKRSVARPAAKPVNSALYHNPNIIREEPEKEVKKETIIEERLETCRHYWKSSSRNRRKRKTKRKLRKKKRRQKKKTMNWRLF